MKIYVASSWRNAKQPEVVQALVDAGHDVYDFRNPEHGKGGFHWSDIDPQWKAWTPEQFRFSLFHTLARDGFGCDFAAMKWAEACVLVMPCGRSAHLEAGYFVGAGKPLAILLADGEPELMYSMAERIETTLSSLVGTMRKWERVVPPPPPQPERLKPAQPRE